jgi:hypothetical protein
MPGRSGRDDRQGVRSYGAPLGPAAPADDPAPRPAPRQASDDQVKQALRANDAAVKRESTAGLYRGSSPSPAPASASQSGTDPATKDLSVQGAAEKLRNRGRQIDQAVDDAS